MSDEKEIKTLSQELKTQREMYFHTPIFYKDIKDSAKLNEHLLKHILTWKKRDEKGINRTNSLGWHSAVDMHTRKEYDNLLRHLFDMQKEIYTAEGYHPDTEPFCDTMWANVNYKYSHNRNHVHPGAQWSGVYYVKVPENSGHIWFTDPCGQRHLDLPIMDNSKTKPVHYWREVNYTPIEGRLIMFPGWLTHEVAQNMSNLKGEKGWRVSVSFNFKQRWKTDQYKPPVGGHDRLQKTIEDLNDKLSKHIKFIDSTYANLKNPIEAARKWLGK